MKLITLTITCKYYIEGKKVLYRDIGFFLGVALSDLKGSDGAILPLSHLTQEQNSILYDMIAMLTFLPTLVKVAATLSHMHQSDLQYLSFA